MRAKTRRTVVAAAGFDSGAVELVDGGLVGCGEGHMNGSGRGFPFLDPEISTALLVTTYEKRRRLRPSA
jgi:hypothetical protein